MDPVEIKKDSQHDEEPQDTSTDQVDNSNMPHEARRVLVYLLRQGLILAAQKPKLFELLCRYQGAIRKHLSELYLQLTLDGRAGVAFVANVDETEASDDVYRLISKRTLSLYDTLLLLVLRKHYQEREASGEQKITIDLERLESYMTPFLPLTDHASLDRKKLLVRVKEMVKKKLLSSIRGSEDRYEITPVIRYVVNAEFLETMLVDYQRLAEESGVN